MSQHTPSHPKNNPRAANVHTFSSAHSILLVIKIAVILINHYIVAIQIPH